MAKQRKSSAPSPIEAAIQKGELTTIQQLLAAGHKPDAAAAEETAKACNEAFELANQTEKPLFGRRATLKEKQKAAGDAEIFYQITEMLLKAGAPAPQQLCPAACAGNTKLALLLIKRGADVDYAPPMGTPLENAVKAGSLEIVRALIKAGADIQVQGIGGSLLNRAIKVGKLDLLDELIKAGVNVNAKPRFGATALHAAVTDRKTEFVSRLLAAGADVNSKASVTCGEGRVIGLRVVDPPVAYDSTPLIVAARLGFAEIAEQLIKAGADVEAVDREGFTAMVHAQKANDLPIIELLKRSGAKAPKYAEGSAEAALLAAAGRGDCARLQELLDEGVDPNLKRLLSKEMQEVTALRSAAENGHVAAIRLLINAGARPDETLRCGFESDRQTALMHAALKGQYAACQALIEAGASAVARDRGGKTVLHFAAEGGHADLIRLLAKAGAKVQLKDKSSSTPLIEAAGAGHLEAAQALLELGADPNLGSKDGLTPLANACMSGRTKVTRLLLKAGASPKSATPHFSPLELASSGGHKEIVDLLLQAGAGGKKTNGKKPVSEPEDGSALVNSALMGNIEIVRTLLENGADPNAADEEHFTALMAGVRSGNSEIVRLLLKAGAEVNALNESRETAFDLAYDNIKVAKDQAKFLKMLGDDDMDEDTRKAIQIIQNAGKRDEITTALVQAGGKPGKDLKGQAAPRRPEPEPEEDEEEVVEVEIPDFSGRARNPDFQKAIEETTKLCGKKPKPLTNEEGGPLTGCVSYQLSAEEVDRILAAHHEAFLKRGCYLLRSERGYTTGKDSLTLLPTNDRNEVLAAFQTNGANCEVYQKDVMNWLDELAKGQPFLLTGAGFDWCEGRFTTPLADTKKLARKMYEFCPDIVDQGCGDVARLALELKKTQKFFFWWD